MGYGNYAYLSSIYGTGIYQAMTMHIGYLDILYVGGIPYCLLWLAIIFGVIRRIRLQKNMDAYETACLVASVLILFSLLFELARGMLVGSFFQYTALSTVLCLRPSEKRNGETHENLLQRETGI
jgi:hypothetical protein